jgi:hypothetical protein
MSHRKKHFSSSACIFSFSFLWKKKGKATGFSFTHSSWRFE